MTFQPEADHFRESSGRKSQLSHTPEGIKRHKRGICGSAQRNLQEVSKKDPNHSPTGPKIVPKATQRGTMMPCGHQRASRGTIEESVGVQRGTLMGPETCFVTKRKRTWVQKGVRIRAQKEDEIELSLQSELNPAKQIEV